MMATGGQWGSASPRQSIVGPVGNPFADLHDWQDAAKAAQALQLERGAQALAVSNWTLASRLAWYARPSRVLALDGKNKQFDIWFGRLVPGQTLIWMNGSQMPQPTPTSCDPAPASTFKGQHASFDFYLCRQP
jgi:hypothetical protein